MNKIYYYITFLSCFLASGPLFADEVTPVSLRECIEQALDRNYSIKIVRNRQQQADNNVTYGSFLPTLNATATQNQTDYQSHLVSSGESIDRNQKSDSYGTGLQLNWTLFDGFAMFADHNRFREMQRIGEATTRLAVENLIVRVSENYYGVIVEQRKLEAARHSLQLSNDRYEEARDKYNIGVLSGLEMQQAKIDLNADSSGYMRQREYLKSAYIALNLAMSGELQQTGYVRDTITLQEPLDLKVLEDQMVLRNTALQIARKERRISELDLEVARSAFYPTISFNTGYTYSRTKTPDAVNTLNQYHGPYWGFSVKVPLFNRLDNLRKMRNARLEVANASLSYDEVQLQLNGDLAQLFNTYENNLRIVDFEDESARVAYENLNAALQKYKIGSLSGIEFREFQRSYIDAVNRKLSAIFQAKVSELSLLLISGGIGVE